MSESTESRDVRSGGEVGDAAVEHARLIRDADAAREAAESAESRLRFALTVAKLGAWEVELASGHMLTSDQCRANFGLPPADAEGAPRFQYDELLASIHPDDRAAMQQAVARALREHTDYYAEYRVIWPDGSEHWIEAQGRAVYDDAGTPIRMTGVTQDITERRRALNDRERLLAAERAARADAERERAELATVLEVVPVGIGIARDPEVRDIRVNPAFAAQLGIRAEVNASKSGPEAATLPFTVHQHGRELTADELPMQRAAREGVSIQDMLVEVRHDDGRSVRLLEYAAPLFDAQGRVRGAVGAFVDVTERERLLEAEQAARAEAESARLAAEEARRAADEANRAKSDFLAVMSHELRTPLNAIAGYAELLELGVRGPITPAQAVDIARIQAAQRTLMRRINDVLNFAKLEAGHVEFDSADVSVANLLGSVEPLVAPQVVARELRYETLPVDPALHARIDEEKASQVLLNLVANAVKFTPAGGRVTVSAAAIDDTRVEIVVRDTGIGIPASKLPRIFDPFVQVDTRLHREHEGTGLGLAISRDLVRGMGGELSVESTEGAGSAFRLVLPRTPR